MHKCYKINRDNYSDRWDCVEAQSPEDAVYWATGEKVKFIHKTESGEFYANAGRTKCFIVEEIKQACLTFKDVLKMVEYLCNTNPVIRNQITSAGIEDSLVNAIRYVTRVDFTEDMYKNKGN